MPGPIVHLGAVVTCMHAGPAQPTAPFPRVLVSGQPVVTLATPYVVAGCALTSVPSPPCVSAQWVVGRDARLRRRRAGHHANEPGGLRPDRPGFARHHHSTAGHGNMNIDFPYHFNTRGRTAEVDYDAHIRDLIEQVLFTAPGERVNRPDFGSGLLRLVFAPNSDQLAATTQYLVQGSLQQYLGDLIQVDAVDVTNEDSILRVSVRYLVRRTQALQTAEFTKGVATA